MVFGVVERLRGEIRRSLKLTNARRCSFSLLVLVAHVHRVPVRCNVAPPPATLQGVLLFLSFHFATSPSSPPFPLAALACPPSSHSPHTLALSTPSCTPLHSRLRPPRCILPPNPRSLRGRRAHTSHAQARVSRRCSSSAHGDNDGRGTWQRCAASRASARRQTGALGGALVPRLSAPTPAVPTLANPVPTILVPVLAPPHPRTPTYRQPASAHPRVLVPCVHRRLRTPRPRAPLHPACAHVLAPRVRALPRPRTPRRPASSHPASSHAIAPRVRARHCTPRPRTSSHPASAHAIAPRVRARHRTPRPRTPLHPASAHVLAPHVRALPRPRTPRPLASLHPASHAIAPPRTSRPPPATSSPSPSSHPSSSHPRPPPSSHSTSSHGSYIFIQ
ncbi:hypothetical protein PLICRDRAFT_181146 [Plicaturopsis crispa FD-325 SS-3]|uniref:Uncharacterized protein n=1 Tax=Plicaturopsis crispa FD-325 SS-3 TaxID=944288 RepID=A0A0C9SPJ8_PLICR|nr:hypothetical protein PLICRDRAFT_181146 [Plicaturopsis crispa FD-325 SS-3]